MYKYLGYINLECLEFILKILDGWYFNSLDFWFIMMFELLNRDIY